MSRASLFATAGIPLAVLPPVQRQTPGVWHCYWITNIETGAVDRLFSEHHPPTLPSGWRVMTEAERRSYVEN